MNKKQMASLEKFLDKEFPEYSIHVVPGREDGFVIAGSPDVAENKERIWSVAEMGKAKIRHHMSNPTTVLRITSFSPLKYELTGDSPYQLPIRIGMPPMKFVAIDLGWAMDGAYIGGESEMFGYTLDGDGEITAGQLAEFIQKSQSELKAMWDIYQKELLKIELLKSDQ